jgi:hypothetical protein
VSELWRHPVKSLGGETVSAARLTRDGMVGDRSWAFVDDERGEIRSAKQWPRLLEFRARFAPGANPAPESYGDDVAEVEVVGPDGARYAAHDADAQVRLAAALGAPARLVPLAPPGDRARYRLAARRSQAEMAALMQLQPGEAMPDFAETPPDLLRVLREYATPPGHYYDAYPVHLVTTASLATLHERSGLDTDRRRFRPNLVIDTGEARGWLEFEWVGRGLRAGEAVLAIESKTTRCSMPSRAQPHFGLAEQARLTRALVQHCGRQLGVNARVEREGEVRVGDPVELLG